MLNRRQNSTIFIINCSVVPRLPEITKTLILTAIFDHFINDIVIIHENISGLK